MSLERDPQPNGELLYLSECASSAERRAVLLTDRHDRCDDFRFLDPASEDRNRCPNDLFDDFARKETTTTFVGGTRGDRPRRHQDCKVLTEVIRIAFPALQYDTMCTTTRHGGPGMGKP